MNKLSTTIINSNSPYHVTSDDDALVFSTDSRVEYAVTFDEDANPYFKAYWFNLSNMNQKKSHGDIKVHLTVFCIIEKFFRVNPDILLYLCSTEGERQAQRSALTSSYS